MQMGFLGGKGEPGARRAKTLTPLPPHFHCGDKALKLEVVCPQNGTAVLKGLNGMENVPLRTEHPTRLAWGRNFCFLFFFLCRVTDSRSSSARRVVQPNNVRSGLFGWMKKKINKNRKAPEGKMVVVRWKRKFLRLFSRPLRKSENKKKRASGK